MADGCTVVENCTCVFCDTACCGHSFTVGGTESIDERLFGLDEHLGGEVDCFFVGDVLVGSIRLASSRAAYSSFAGCVVVDFSSDDTSVFDFENLSIFDGDFKVITAGTTVWTCDVFDSFLHDYYLTLARVTDRSICCMLSE